MIGSGTPSSHNKAPLPKPMMFLLQWFPLGNRMTPEKSKCSRLRAFGIRGDALTSLAKSNRATQRVYTSGHSRYADLCKTGVMRDLRAKLKRLRIEAADCDLIATLATDRAERELFARLSRQLLGMAAELEAMIAVRTDDETNSDA
jgi:hypothetical protein